MNDLATAPVSEIRAIIANLEDPLLVLTLSVLTNRIESAERTQITPDDVLLEKLCQAALSGYGYSINSSFNKERAFRNIRDVLAATEPK